MTARQYSSIATPTTLTSAITNSQVTIVVGALTGWPSTFPYTAAIEPDTANEELVTVTAAAGVTVTVVRGVDGSAPILHAATAPFEHRTSARDFQEPQNHIYAVSEVHGITGNVVGDSDEQALTNKILDGTVNTFQNIPVSAISGGSATQLLARKQSPSWPTRTQTAAAAGGVDSAVDLTYATVSFTVPSSGDVWLTSQGTFEFQNDGFYPALYWKNHSGGAVVSDSRRVGNNNGAQGASGTATHLVTGLTPGASITLDLWASINGGTAGFFVGDISVSCFSA